MSGLLLAMWLGCTGPETLPPDAPTYTLRYGGDLIMGRRLNAALYEPQRRAQILGDVAPVLREADIALLNAEGVIAEGGQFSDKGESRPYMFRAHPAALEVLTAAGVDAVTVGNNHSGDYGPDALREMLDRLQLAGVAYAGAGYDRADAMTPAYLSVGELTVAIVGADLTIAEPFAATASRPGVLWLPGLKGSRRDEVVEALTGILREAEQHADVVILSPHWGANFAEGPSKKTRAIARKLIRAGYDAIIGHSAHRIHGAELIDGRPVLYDAGNFVLDSPGSRSHPALQGMVFSLTFNAAGVTGVEAIPLTLQQSEARLADGAIADSILEKWKSGSEALGEIAITLEDGVGRFRCEPGALRKPAAPPPTRQPPPAVRAAPHERIVDALPADAVPLEARWENGARLRGVKLATGRLAVPKGAEIVSLFWERGEAPLPADLHVVLEARSASSPGSDRADHLPGDWLLPADRWPLGKLVVDRTLFRLMRDPAEGTVEFWVGLMVGGRNIPLAESPLKRSGDRVLVGTSVYDPEAPKLFEQLTDR